MIGYIMNFILKFMTVVLACSGIWSYLNYISLRPIEYATDQRDHSENRIIKKLSTKIGETFTDFKVKTEVKQFAENWPCFRGTKRDNLVLNSISLSKSWDQNGPRVLWRTELGEGYSGAIIVSGRVYVLDYLEKEDSDSLRCFDLFAGTELWRRSYKNPIRRNHGKSRTIPACSDKVIVTIGPAAHVMAVDAINGNLLWTRDLVDEYKCEVPQWYTGQCPFIDDGKVILGIGGEKVLMTALDLKTGKTVWESPNEHGLKMSHSSVFPVVLEGEFQYVYAGIGGIAACDKTGKPLWSCIKWKPAVWAPTPVPVGGNKLFLTAGYGAGSALLTVKKNHNQYEAVIDKEWKPTKGPASEQQTPLVINNTLFVIQPKDAGSLRSELVAADIDALPNIKGSSGKQARFGLGPYLYADNAFWIADDNGILHVYGYENNQFIHLAHHKVLPGVDSWGPIAFAGGLMILRDSTSMVCLDLRKEVQP